jgi:hypothetical protein
MIFIILIIFNAFNRNFLKYLILSKFYFVTLIKLFCDLLMILFFCYEENVIKNHILTQFSSLQVKKL